MIVGHPAGVTYDRMWERLLGYLAEWATAREVPRGIEVTLTRVGVERTVVVVVSPADWDDYVSTIFGSGDPEVTPIRSEIEALPDEHRFLVYDTYDWVPSATAELPDPPAPHRTAGGEWITTGGDGTVHRFADWTEPE